MEPASGPRREAASAPRLGPVLEFMRLIWALDHALHKASKRMGASVGITAPQRLAIRVLGLNPGMRAGRLARVMHLHPSTVTGILDRLEQRGLITRRADPRDRRRAVLGLTARGRTLGAETSGTVEAAVRAAFVGTSGTAVRNAALVLGRIAESLEGRPRRPRRRGASA